MPYILKECYERAKDAPNTTGELNFAFTCVLMNGAVGAITPVKAVLQFDVLITGYVKRKSLCYMTINDILGALLGCSIEFARRVPDEELSATMIDLVGIIIADFYDTVAAPYEDKKIAENGDVYPEALTGVEA